MRIDTSVWALACLMALSCSCTIKPTVVTSPNGTQTATLGGSVMTKNASETSSIVMRDGTQIHYTTTGNDETVVPNAYFGMKTTLGIAEKLQSPANNLINTVGN